MSHRKILFGLSLSAAVGFGAAYVPALVARADNKPAAAPAAAPTCKLHGKNCCDPAVMAHLPKDAVYKACGESDATFLGEDGVRRTPASTSSRSRARRKTTPSCRSTRRRRKRSCRSRTIRSSRWKKVGKVFMTEKAKSPKSAPMIANATGLYLPGKGYFVSVNASTKVCSKAEVKKLAAGR